MRIRMSAPLSWSPKRRIRASLGSARAGSIIITTIATATRQRASFRAHIAAARDAGLPLVVHTRDAEEDTAAILTEEMGKGAFAGVLHCFTGTLDLARHAMDLGFYVSMSGIVTSGTPRSCRRRPRRSPPIGC